MRRFLAAAVAAIAVLAAWAAGAQASSPTWVSCVKAPRVDRVWTGAYENPACSAANPEHHGKYELVEGLGTKTSVSAKGGRAPGVKFTELFLESNSPTRGWKWGCSTARLLGQMAAPNRLVGATLTLKGCTITSAGQAPGVVVMGPMSGELGYLDESHTGVGLDLASESEPGGVLTEFTSRTTGASFVLRGSMIARQTGDLSGVSKVFFEQYVASNWLGETEPGYEPQTNLPSFFEGPQDILTVEQTGGEEELPPGENPAALQLELKSKGPAVEAKRS